MLFFTLEFTIKLRGEIELTIDEFLNYMDRGNEVIAVFVPFGAEKD